MTARTRHTPPLLRNLASSMAIALDKSIIEPVKLRTYLKGGTGGFRTLVTDCSSCRQQCVRQEGGRRPEPGAACSGMEAGGDDAGGGRLAAAEGLPAGAAGAGSEPACCGGAAAANAAARTHSAAPLARGGAAAGRRLPESISMECDLDMVDIEAPPPPAISDDEWDEEDDDGLLLRCFTVATGLCAGFHGTIQRRMLMCGLYLRDRRFWVCKIIILVMDMAILRGAISMGEEYCSQDDEISEFGWILWASFLVFCKFVYLRPVHHLHQLGVFHGSRRDAAKAAMIELLSMVCHVFMLSALLWRTAEPGFSAYRSVTCAEHGRGISSTRHARARPRFHLAPPRPLAPPPSPSLPSLPPVSLVLYSRARAKDRSLHPHSLWRAQR